MAGYVPWAVLAVIAAGATEFTRGRLRRRGWSAFRANIVALSVLVAVLLVIVGLVPMPSHI